MAIRPMLYPLGLCVLTSAAHVLYLSLTTEKTKKGNDRQSTEYSLVVLHSRSLYPTLSHSLSPCFLFFSTRFPAICFPTSFPSLSPQRISLGRDRGRWGVRETPLYTHALGTIAQLTRSVAESRSQGVSANEGGKNVGVCVLDSRV